MDIATTGIDELDDFLGGGVAVGDNIVWISDDPEVIATVERSFLRIDQIGGAGDGGSPIRRRIEARDESGVIRSPRVLEALVLADDVGAGSRVVISSIDDLVVGWGAEAATAFYSRVCPRLFDRGAIAYWSASRDLAGTAVLDAVGRIAQCVFEVRSGRLRVRKAEGRSSRMQGAVASVGVVEDGSARADLMVRAEQAVGRVSEGVRRLRAARGLTQTQVAALAGVTPAAISQVESGRRSLSLESLLTLCDAVGVSLDELLGLGARPTPWLARRDRLSVSPAVPLFEDGPGGVSVHLVTLEPGEHGRPPFPHKGTEVLLVASGLVLVDLGDDSPVLRAGDGAMVVDVAVKRWTNLGEGSATLFWTALPTPGGRSDTIA